MDKLVVGYVTVGYEWVSTTSLDWVIVVYA
jgi:hypothetical protein